MDVDRDDDSAAMAQAMGFSSFGAQNPNKRKYNPAVDNAVVDSPSAPTSLASRPIIGHKKPKSTQASGSNFIPLGERRSVPATAMAVNGEEIALEDIDDQEEQAQWHAGAPSLSSSVQHQPSSLNGSAGNAIKSVPVVAAATTAEAKGHTEADEEDEDQDPEPQYIDTSRPPTSLASTTTATVPTATIPAATDQAATGTTRWNSDPSYSRRGSHGGAGGGGRGGLGRGGNHQWWNDYYDPAVNVNPWEKLEQKLGLNARGRWMSWEESKGSWETMKEKVNNPVAT
jgi:hypothetical protein